MSTINCKTRLIRSHYFQYYLDFGRKRSGDSIRQVVFATLVWPLLPVKSIFSFCDKFIQGYIKGGMNVIYDFLKREDINWRSVSTSVSKKVYLNHNLGIEKESTFAIDDSIKTSSREKSRRYIISF